jgi:Ca2+-binding EF-hand superfamily protein
MNTNAQLLLAVAAAALLASCATTETDRDLFIQSDTNRDGQLSLAEVNKAGLPRLFSIFDVDGNGSVTLAEARTVDPKFDAKMFNERDLDRDGKVTWAENEKVAMSKGGLKKDFAAVDTDGDGMIEKAEAEAYVDRRNAAVR